MFNKQELEMIRYYKDNKQFEPYWSDELNRWVKLVLEYACEEKERVVRTDDPEYHIKNKLTVWPGTLDIIAELSYTDGEEAGEYELSELHKELIKRGKTNV